MQKGIHLKKIREKNGMTVRSFAERLNVAPSYISRVENNKVPPSKELVKSIAKTFQANGDILLALTGHLPNKWQKAVRETSHLQYGQVPKANGDNGPTPIKYGLERLVLNGLGSLVDPLLSLFPSGYVPSPQLNEVYELKLAALEANLLRPADLIDRGAYFLEINGQPTNHFRVCTGKPLQIGKDGSLRLKSFFNTHQFKTSYATHGLFPYRGKFHPQMIKAIINVMGLKPGDKILDPMMGSGTTVIEASLMGIDAVGVDVSPFCVFTSKAKLGGLNVPLQHLQRTIADKVLIKRQFDYLSSKKGQESIVDSQFKPDHITRDAFNLIALAYLDSQGFARRSGRNSHSGFFEEVLKKYCFAIDKFQSAKKGFKFELGQGEVLEADSRHLPLPANSIDGALFSPPYSFAVDYLDNDLTQLEYMKCDADKLRDSMIGLRGKKGRERVEIYFDDMKKSLQEIKRVLKPGKYCVIVVGSNSNQLSEALGLDPDSDESKFGLEMKLIEMANDLGLNAELTLRRLIVGMANSMREEHILFFKSNPIAEMN